MKQDTKNHIIYGANIAASIVNLPGNFIGGAAGLALKASDDNNAGQKELREELRGYAMGFGAIDTLSGISSTLKAPTIGMAALGGLETVADVLMMYALVKDQEKSTGLAFGDMLKVTGRYYVDRTTRFIDWVKERA
ncbi:MAG: hypothetical protein WC916_00335 [Candidatus Woesearchaeota archaeon]